MQAEHTGRYINEQNLFELHKDKSKFIFSSPGWHPGELKFDIQKDVY